MFNYLIFLSIAHAYAYNILGNWLISYSAFARWSQMSSKWKTTFIPHTQLV